jgi:hypothetical protein
LRILDRGLMPEPTSCQNMITTVALCFNHEQLAAGMPTADRP